MTIKNESELQADFTSGFRNITAAFLRDLVDSRFSVGGQMGGQNTPADATRNLWVNWNGFTESSEKGLIADLVNGQFTVDPALVDGADGVYNIDLGTILTVTSNLVLRLAVTLNGTRIIETPEITMQPNDPKAIPLMGRRSLIGGDVLGVQVFVSFSGGVDNIIVGGDLSQFRLTRT